MIVRARNLTWAAWLMLGLTSPAWAQGGDFRVNTTVLAGEEQHKVAENRTLFLRDRVYDVSIDSGEISILDLKAYQFVLLDPRRKVKTVVDTREVFDTTRAILERIRQERGPGFAANYDVHSEEGWIVVTDKVMTYKAQGEKPPANSPASSSAPVRYQHFADWYARINAMRGAIPPFTRMRLNEELAKQNLMPKVIQRVIGSGRNSQTVEAHHVAVWLLSSADRQRIEKIGEYLASFDSVGAEAYFARGEVVAQNKREQ